MSGPGQQYVIKQAFIAADRFGGFDENYIDVKTMIVEVSLYESLDKPYVSGEMVILDDKGLFEKMSFKGTEKLQLTIAGVTTDESGEPVEVFPPGGKDVTKQRTFVITSVDSRVKSGAAGNASLYTMSFVDEHAFLNSLKEVSKSYTGRITDIMSSIILSELNKSVDASYTETERSTNKLIETQGFQENVKVIIPSLSPLAAVKWLQKRATTKNGSPYFVWASIHDDRLRIGNLDTMLTQDAWNSKLPFTYGQSNISTAEKGTGLERASIIKDISYSDMGNSFGLVKAGSIGAEYANTNLNTGRISKSHYSFRKTLENLSNDNIINIKKQNVFDTEAKFGDRLMDDYDAIGYHTITSSGVYGEQKSYHDEYDASRFQKKIESKAIKNHLIKDMFNIAVAGESFFISGAGAGDIISLLIAGDDVERTEDGHKDDLIDNERSGDALIYDVRHTFNGTQHTVSMNVCKLERL